MGWKRGLGGIELKNRFAGRLCEDIEVGRVQCELKTVG